jgi:hypothetical protein
MEVVQLAVWEPTGRRILGSVMRKVWFRDQPGK